MTRTDPAAGGATPGPRKRKEPLIVYRAFIDWGDYEQEETLGYFSTPRRAVKCAKAALAKTYERVVVAEISVDSDESWRIVFDKRRPHEEDPDA